MKIRNIPVKPLFLIKKHPQSNLNITVNFFSISNLLPFIFLTSILRKVMDEQDDNWDDYIDGALFAIKTNVSTTAKCSPFFVMFGRHPRMPFQVEKFVTPLEEGDEVINNVMTELCSDDGSQAHIEKMTEIRDAVFPKIERNIDVAQQKQKQQYLKRTGGLKFTFNNGDNVLRGNMLQKTSKGHKMEDQWIGPYTVEGLDLVKRTCQLRAKDGRLLQRKINLKDLKLYREQSTSQTPSNDALLQVSPVGQPLKDQFHLRVSREE